LSVKVAGEEESTEVELMEELWGVEEWAAVAGQVD
jgi:hypothetical protein